RTLATIDCAATLYVTSGTFSVTGTIKSKIDHLQITGATVSLTPNVTSDDIKVLSGGTLDIPMAHDVANLTLNTNGAVTGAGDLNVTGSFNTKGGSGTAGPSLHAGGKLILAAGAVGNVQDSIVLGRVFDNYGTVAGDPSVGAMYWYLGPTPTEPG